MGYQSLNDYYSDPTVLKSILDSVESPGLRIWKVVDSSGIVHQNKKKINSIRKLKQLLGDSPQKVFVSVSEWSAPERNYGKTPQRTQWEIADSVFLHSDLLFDLDSEQDLSIAHKDGKEIIKFMNEEKDYRLRNIRFSGEKGFHLNYYDLYCSDSKDAIYRYRIYENRRKELVNRLPELKTVNALHKNIFVDQFRVQAALETIKAKSGNKVVEITVNDFLSLSTDNLLRKYVERPVSQEAMIMEQRKHILTSTNKGEERSGLISYPHTYNFVSNKVDGIGSTKKDWMYIPVLKYPVEKDVKQLLQETQRRYSLSDLYGFKYGDIQMWISFKLVSRWRLDKIMKFAHPINLSSYLFHGHIWIPISDAIDSKRKVVMAKPVYFDTIETEFNQKHTHSRPHLFLFDIEYPHIAGASKPSIKKAIVESGGEVNG